MKILLIEDDAFFQKFYAFKLQEQGYQVVNAVDGEDGLLKLQQELPNLVLLDLIMPNKDGFDVLAAKQAAPAVAQIPVIVFSTLGQEEDIKRALTLGATDYINKSFFDFDALLAKIQALVGPAQ
jgi:DNA-binding response OmpR family regulator